MKGGCSHSPWIAPFSPGLGGTGGQPAVPSPSALIFFLQGAETNFSTMICLQAENFFKGKYFATCFAIRQCSCLSQETGEAKNFSGFQKIPDALQRRRPSGYTKEKTSSSRCSSCKTPPGQICNPITCPRKRAGDLGALPLAHSSPKKLIVGGGIYPELDHAPCCRGR